MNKFTILLGGDLIVTQRLRKQIDNSRIIAADSGMKHAKLLDVVPEWWIGDFDSSNQDLQKNYCHIARKNYPVDKDATDGELAIDLALANGATEIILCGAFGGERTDHTVLHMTLAIAKAKAGVVILMTSGKEEGRPLLPGKQAIGFPKGTTCSIIGLTDLENVSLAGVKWPLIKQNIALGSSLTLSNVTTENFSINIDKGYGILLTQHSLKSEHLMNSALKLC